VLRMCSALPSLFFQTRFSLAKKVFQFWRKSMALNFQRGPRKC
jgi:hypothetical protein